MSKFNECYLEGRAGKDAQTKELSNGKKLTTFTMSVWQPKAAPRMWLQVKCFDFGEAETIAKGDNVSVTGRLFWEGWTDKEGKERSQWGIMADKVEVLKFGEEMEAF